MKPKDFFKKIREDRQPRKEFRSELRLSLIEYMKDNPPLPEVAFGTPRNMGAGTWRKGATIAIATVVTLLTGAIGTVFASQKALPGDALYGIKLAADQLSIDITRSPAVKANVAARRIDEVKQALASPSAQTPQVQEDIQSALKQYRSDAEDTVTVAPTSSVVSVSSTTPTIFRSSEGERRATTTSPPQSHEGEDHQSSFPIATPTSTLSHSEDFNRENATNSHNEDTPHPTSSSTQTFGSPTSDNSEDFHFQIPDATTTVPLPVTTATGTMNGPSTSTSYSEGENGSTGTAPVPISTASSSKQESEDRHDGQAISTFHSSSSTESKSD